VNIIVENNILAETLSENFVG